MIALVLPLFIVGAASLLDRRSGGGASVGYGGSASRAPGRFRGLVAPETGVGSYFDAGVVGASESEPATGQTRPSCTECVEKHLGTAWVLMKEHRDGYAHRWLVIGHLHEAEDESQKWPMLSEKIRESRKDYHREGKVPDFVALMDMVDVIKAAG